MREKIRSVIAENKLFLSGLAMIVILVGIFALYLSNKSMPLPEGWYAYYAQHINNGSSVYKDFEYLFTPLYITFISFFIKIFGGSILASRLLGVIMFLAIAVIIYLIMTRSFSVGASVFGSITGVLYLQSEVYTVFYDYSRFMDIVSYLSILFMVTVMKRLAEERRSTEYVILWGIFSSFFVLIKQNMGLLFSVYSVFLLFMVLIYFGKSIKNICFSLLQYIIAWIIPIAAIFGIIYLTNDMDLFLNSTIFGAIEAKGGMQAILFNWIINGKATFQLYILEAFVLIFILIINYRLSKNNGEKGNENRNFWITFLGWLVFCIGMICVLYNRSTGEWFASFRETSSYLVFLVCFLLLLLFIIIYIAEMFKDTNKYACFLPLLSVLGAFFAISYGAGTSGGLSVGESAVGVAVIVCLFYDSLKNRFSYVMKFLTICFCIFISLRNIGIKLIVPCSWWGINSESIYDCTEDTDIDVLKGIKLAESEKGMYEGIVDIIRENTDSKDSIYCFPCIPIIYCMSERMDPGVYSKVQWFDVSTNESLQKDIDVIKESFPKVIVIQNLFEFAYSGHESAFRMGNVSGTRNMRDFLYQFVYTNSYKYAGNFVSANNNISVFVYDESDFNQSLEGQGTKKSPYLIKTSQELVNWAMQANRGNAEKNIYYKLAADLDLTHIIWVPAGQYSSCDNIELEYGDYNIYNINIEPDRYNLGQEIIK